ncbi:MAG: hypothetical protein ACRYF3_08890 [Janthinobacterium lividum]
MAIQPRAENIQKFEKLLTDEKLTDMRQFGRIDVIDEPPLFSRLSRIDFLSGLPLAEQNRQLIRAAVWHYERTCSYLAKHPDQTSPDILNLVSVTDWWVDHPQGGGEPNTNGQVDLLRPHFWLADLSHPDLSAWHVRKPRTMCGAFVQEVLDHSTDYEVFEATVDEIWTSLPVRVYIALTGAMPRDRIV